MKESINKKQKSPINFNKKQINKNKFIIKNKNNNPFLMTIENTNRFNNGSLLLFSKNNENKNLRTQNVVYINNKKANGDYIKP